MTLRDILQAKGTDVFTTTPRVSLQEAVDEMVRRGCGSLVVVDQPGSRRLMGIITERDILKTCASRNKALGEIDVSAAMSSRVHTVAPDDSVSDIMGLMTGKRIRHIPIIEDGQLAGIISIGDVVKAQHDELMLENHCLKSYIHGDPSGSAIF